jgi:hypothetical protein
MKTEILSRASLSKLNKLSKLIRETFAWGMPKMEVFAALAFINMQLLNLYPFGFHG